MKTNSIIKSALLVAGFSAFALVGSAQAGPVVNVDLNKPSGPSGTYSGAGVAPSGTDWNGLTLSTGSSAQSWSSLQTSTGGSTSIGLTVAPTGGQVLNYYDTASDGVPAAVAPALMNDFVYSSGFGDIDFTFSNLNAGDTYNLYIYAQNGGYDSQLATFTIGSTTLTAVNAGQGGGTDTSFVLGSNYLEFTGLTGSTSLSGALDGALSGGNAGINGFQLVDTSTPVETPEPSTYALMGLGALALLVISRRRRTV